MTPIFILSLALAAEPQSALDIERQAMDEREKITSGEVTFDVTRRRFDREGELSRSDTSRYEVTFDGSNVRTIKNQREKFAFTNKYEFSEFAGLKEAHKRDLTTPQGRRVYLDSYRINLRLLGIVPEDTQGFKTHKVSEYLTQPKREDTKLTTLHVNNQKLFKIEYERTDFPTKVTLVIDPEKDYSVIEASRETPDHVSRIENTLKHYDDKFWYPETVRYTRSFGGKMTSESLVTVKKAEFNKPIDKDVFSFKGISLPAGTRVQETPSTGPTRYWDGEKLVPKSELDPDIEDK